jgi:AcrR family transcriptional regulator
MNDHSAMARNYTASDQPVNPAKQEAILSAALELFSERTYEGTAVPLLAQRAGVGAGTIYRYFENKEALVNAVYRRWASERKRLLVDSMPDAPAREQFRHFWRGLWQLAAEQPHATLFLEAHHHAPYLDERSCAIRDEFLDGAAAILEHAQASGQVRRATPHMLGALIFGAFTGLLKRLSDHGEPVTEAYVAESEEIVWKMLEA